MGNATKAQCHLRRPAFELIEAEPRLRAKVVARRVLALQIDQSCDDAVGLVFVAPTLSPLQ